MVISINGPFPSGITQALSSSITFVNMINNFKLNQPLIIRENPKTRGTQRRFPPALKTLFRLSRVPLDLWKCILSSAIKFVSVLSS